MTTAIPLAAAVVPDRVLHCSTQLRVDVFDLTSIVIVAVRGVVEAASVDWVIAAVQGAVLRPRPIVIDVSASAGWIDPALVAAARRTGGDVFLVLPGGKATVGRQEEMTGTDGWCSPVRGSSGGVGGGPRMSGSAIIATFAPGHLPGGGRQ